MSCLLLPWLQARCSAWAPALTACMELVGRTEIIIYMRSRVTDHAAGTLCSARCAHAARVSGSVHMLAHSAGSPRDAALRMMVLACQLLAHSRHGSQPPLQALEGRGRLRLRCPACSAVLQHMCRPQPAVCGCRWPPTELGMVVPGGPRVWQAAFRVDPYSLS